MQLSGRSELKRTRRGWTRIRNALKKIAATPEHARTERQDDGRRWREVRVECVGADDRPLPTAGCRDCPWLYNHMVRDIIG